MKKYYAYIVITLFLVLGVFAPLAPTHTSNNTVHYVYADSKEECEKRGGTWTSRSGAEYCIEAETDPAPPAAGNGSSGGEGGTQTPTQVKEVKDKSEGDSKVGAQPQKINSNYLDCSWWNMGCHLFNGLGHLSFIVGSVLAAMAGVTLDFFLSHSISSGAYKDAGFILEGWEILRDFTNIAFIFALLMIAFKIVLGINESQAKGQIIKIILVALTINFSLFVSFAIIDVSNIFAHTFFNKIVSNNYTYTTASYEDSQGKTNQAGQQITNNSVSLGLATHINPQRMITQTGPKSFGQKLIIVFIVGIVNYVLIVTFLSVTFLFLGRTVGLWIATVLAPLAFTTIAVPELAKVKYIGFKQWLNSLLNMAFMAPIFIFLLYLTIQFMKIKVGGTKTGNLFFDTILNVLISSAVVIVLISTSKDVAKSMSGDFAGVVSGIVAKVAGGALAVGGLAVTGGAAALSGGAARAAGALGFKNTEKKLKGFSRWSGTRKLDVSKLPGFGQMFGKEGQKFTQGISGRSIIGHIEKKRKDLAKKGDPFDDREAIAKDKKARLKAQGKNDRISQKTAEDYEREFAKVKQAEDEATANARLDSLDPNFRKNQAEVVKQEKQINTQITEKENRIGNLQEDMTKSDTVIAGFQEKSKNASTRAGQAHDDIKELNKKKGDLVAEKYRAKTKEEQEKIQKEIESIEKEVDLKINAKANAEKEQKDADAKIKEESAKKSNKQSQKEALQKEIKGLKDNVQKLNENLINNSPAAAEVMKKKKRYADTGTESEFNNDTAGTFTNKKNLLEGAVKVALTVGLTALLPGAGGMVAGGLISAVKSIFKNKKKQQQNRDLEQQMHTRPKEETEESKWNKWFKKTKQKEKEQEEENK